VKEAYVPPIPQDRLDAMWMAIARHIAAIDHVDIGEPLSRQMAVEVEQAIKLLTHGPQRPARYRQEDLHAAQIARTMIHHAKIPQAEAVEVAFDNPEGLDVESLARKYRNLCKKLPPVEYTSAAEMNIMLTAERRLSRHGEHLARLEDRVRRLEGK